MTRVQIFRVSKREACSGGVVKRVPRSGVYDADPVVRLAFTYLGQVMARSRLFVYTKLDASHLATRRWFFEALATSATGWPCKGLSCVWRSTKGGVSPLVLGSSRSCAGYEGFVQRCGGQSRRSRTATQLASKWHHSNYDSGPRSLREAMADDGVVVASISEGAWSTG